MTSRDATLAQTQDRFQVEATETNRRSGSAHCQEIQSPGRHNSAARPSKHHIPQTPAKESSKCADEDLPEDTSWFDEFVTGGESTDEELQGEGEQSKSDINTTANTSASKQGLSWLDDPSDDEIDRLEGK